MKELVLSKESLVWLGLMLATGVAWWLGADHGAGEDASPALIGVALMVIAFVKVRFVIQYFMDARNAAWPLRLITELWPVAVCTAVLLVFLLRG